MQLTSLHRLFSKRSLIFFFLYVCISQKKMKFARFRIIIFRSGLTKQFLCIYTKYKLCISSGMIGNWYEKCLEMASYGFKNSHEIEIGVILKLSIFKIQRERSHTDEAIIKRVQNVQMFLWLKSKRFSYNKFGWY